MELIDSVHDKLWILTVIMAADRAQWDAVGRWTESPGSPDESNYHAPATYLYYAMRLILHACDRVGCAPPDHAPDVIDDLEHVKQASAALDTAALILARADVRATLNSLSHPNPDHTPQGAQRNRVAT